MKTTQLISNQLVVFFTRFKHVSLKPCETAEAGLEIVNQYKSDLILMDDNLSGISEIEAAQKLHDTPEFTDTPLMARALDENINSAQGLFAACTTQSG